jgi:hypothetical protein
MEKNIKVRVTQYYRDIVEDTYFTAGTVRYLDYQRARELLSKGLIVIMEIRKCK